MSYDPDHRDHHHGHDAPPETGYAAQRGQGRAGEGGIPDGFLLTVLALLLGTTVLTWTSTGLAALLSHGSWPPGVTFTRTPLALRALATDPTDLAGAWPAAAASQLSGYGLFWGLLIGQILILAVLTVFAVGTVTRARAVRAARRKRAARPPMPPEPKPDVREDLSLSSASTQNAGFTENPKPPETTEPAVPAVPVPPAPVGPSTDPDLHTRVQDAPGAVIVATSDPDLWATTKDSRAKLGPVHLFDPGQLCDTPDRLRWSPNHGCTDRATAAARAKALLEPLRSSRPIDAESHSSAETLLRCWLHASALDDRPFRDIHRWTLAKTTPTDPVQTLRTHPKASPEAAGELEAVLTGHPRHREEATALVRRALAPLSQLHIRNACTAARADRIALESFIAETGTLYVIGADPELMPLLNALTQSALSHPAPGPLDPPVTTILQLPF